MPSSVAARGLYVSENGKLQIMKMRDIKEPMIKLLEDAAEAERLLEEQDTQFFRRAYIRSLFSSTEGIIWLMKQTCLKANPVVGMRKIAIADYAILADESYDLKNNGETSVQTKFLKLPDNLRFTVKTVNRLFGAQLDLGVGTTKWENFKKAIEVRNRITHPRNTSEVDISDDEIEMCKEVSSWFNELVHEFMQSLVKNSKLTEKVPENKTAE